MNPSSTSLARRVLTHSRLIDLAIALVLLGGSGAWATRFWNAWTANGGQPVFYQGYFEPAVMVACGRGFVVAEAVRPAALDDFLSLKRDSITCADLPADLPVGRKGLYQGAWIYLQTTVGWAWWLLGISWSGMGPLFGMLFGIVIAIAYGICRLGIGRPAAVVCALGLATSSIHLTNLPHLRDYAKAPFTVALVFILGVLVTRPVRRNLLLALALAYGAVLGIGYGFRTDFLVNVPVFVLAVFAFVDGGLTKNLILKTSAAAVFAATFMLVSWPAASTVYQQGGCQWHVSLLGLQAPFDDALHVARAPYDFGYAYSDGYIAQTVYGYGARMDPSAAALQFCSHEYDVQSGRLLRAIVLAFPADLITRAYGSVLQVAELPFLSWASPLPGWATSLYEMREAVLRPRIGWGVYLGAASLLMVSLCSVRLGLFLLFFVAYFGGYPAIQFQERHHFHLEFITWWAAGFVVHQAIAKSWLLGKGVPAWAPAVGSVARAAAFSALTVAVIVVSLIGARRYQHGRAVALLGSYVDAAKAPLDVPGGALQGIAPREWPQLLEVDLDQARCGRNPSVTFRYAAGVMNSDLSRTVTIDRLTRTSGVTRIFQPVFENYLGLEVSDRRDGCLAGAFRVLSPEPLPVLLGATLPPGWQSSPLYQRLADWESDPTLPPFVPLPALSTWTTVSARPVSVNLFGSGTIVGDQSTSGYQATSPVVAAPAGARVFVRLSLSASRGRVCVGALNGTTAAWLAPAVPPNNEMSFMIDETAGFMVAIANCNPVETVTPSRFRIGSASYAIE